MNWYRWSSLSLLGFCAAGVLALPNGSASKCWACCSTAPARFSQTRGLAAEVERDGKIYHLLGYQNTAESLVAPKPGAPTGNALFLPIPAVANSMGPKNILDTSSGPNILKDLEMLVLPVSKGRSVRSVDQLPNSVQVFSHDIYTIVLASDARDIAKALEKVPASRRPAMNPEIFGSYQKWYPGWTFALCCFDVRKQTEAKPMLWYYQPRDPQHLFFPALDAHDGKPPQLGAMVATDHTLMAASSKMAPRVSANVIYRDRSMTPQLRAWLPTSVIGGVFRQSMKNGDFVMDVREVRQGVFKPQRVEPPGAH